MPAPTEGATLVTGGASGLGAATARHLHASGARVVVLDVDAGKGEALVASLGDRAAFVAGDVLDPADVTSAIDLAASLGGLRSVVACAGGARVAGGPTVNDEGTAHDLEAFADTISLNVVGSFNTMRLAAAAMSELAPVTEDGERGAIVLVASIAGYEGNKGTIAYGTSKAGLIGMTIIAARDLASRGVRVNTIAPGTMETEAWGKVPVEMRDRAAAKVPFPTRLGNPGEFAALAEHLLTNTYMNGAVVRIDGAVRLG